MPDIYDEANSYREACCEAKAQVRKLQAELEKHRWIPVEEPPKESGLYQVVRKHNTNPTTRYFYAKPDSQFDSHDIVTHWKPITLPEQEASK